MATDTKANTLLPIIREKVKGDSVVYADTYRSYNALDVLKFKHNRINHSQGFSKGTNYINGIENFWSRAKPWVRKFNDVPKTHFHLYLKECELRFNTRNKKTKKSIKTIVKSNIALPLRVLICYNCNQMQISRIVISCFLLFTSSLGFAHYLIPHCEAGNIEHKIATHHENHHQHTPGDNLDHGHVVHNDHLDGGIYDLIVCFLSEMEHSTEDCNLKYYLLAKTNDKINTQLTITKLIAVLFTICCIAEQNETVSAFSGEATAIYLSPPIDNAPNRGPPSISC